jgi:D-methionine transport system permease protein
VLLPEAIPALISGATLTAVTLVGYSAMAGAVGSGGLGDFAIKYGYTRFNTPVLLVAVVMLVILVQLIQSTGDFSVRHVMRKRGLTAADPKRARKAAAKLARAEQPEQLAA